jgi:hypothetical protein
VLCEEHGILTNEKIGRLFGMTYSSITHIVRSVRLRIEENPDLKEKFNQIYSLYKICHQYLADSAVSHCWRNRERVPSNEQDERREELYVASDGP